MPMTRIIPIYGMMAPFSLFCCGIVLYFYHIFNIFHKKSYNSIQTAKKKKYNIIYIFNSSIFLIFLSFVIYVNLNIYNAMIIFQSLAINAYKAIDNINYAALSIQHTTTKLNKIIEQDISKLNITTNFNIPQTVKLNNQNTFIDDTPLNTEEPSNFSN